MASQLEIPHLSTGKVFRQAICDRTALGKRIEKLMESGLLVPDETVVEVVEETIAKPQYSNGYILDGFPRTLKQARSFDQTLKNRGEALDLFLSIHVPEQELIQRILHRGEGRSDDTLEKIKVRLQVYEKETAPVLEHYKNSGVLRSVDGTGSVDDIFDRIIHALPVH